MGGENPYIPKPKTTLPQKKFKIGFPGQNIIVEVDPANIPTAHTGLPGSILDIALASGVDIDHACGGVVACSTCHVVIKQGLKTCNESTDEEEDQLDKAPGLTPFSRLACQAVPNGDEDLVVEVPNWNRNLVRE